MVDLAVGVRHACAITGSGSLYCWGEGGDGALGYGNQSDVGDDETSGSVGPVPTGKTVESVITGRGHTCARLEGGSVRCWGWGVPTTGVPGQSMIDDASQAVDVDLGGPVVDMATRRFHSCALRSDGNVITWGGGEYALGHPGYDAIGDDETPASVGPVDYE